MLGRSRLGTAPRILPCRGADSPHAWDQASPEAVAEDVRLKRAGLLGLLTRYRRERPRLVRALKAAEREWRRGVHDHYVVQAARLDLEACDAALEDIPKMVEELDTQGFLTPSRDQRGKDPNI